MSQEELRPWLMTSQEQVDLEDAIQHLKYLEPIAQSLSTLAAQERLTTPQLVSNVEPEVIRPISEIATAANPEVVTLPDGRTVPTSVIQALTAYDANVWPGALVPEARAAVASVVLREVKSDEVPALRTNYPFCLDDPEEASNDSPCIKRAEHNGKHQDNNDGTW